MRAIINAIERDAGSPEDLAEFCIHGGRLRLRNESSAHPRLVTDDNKRQTHCLELTKRFRRARNRCHLGGIGWIVRVFDQRTVAVEETAARFRESSINGLQNVAMLEQFIKRHGYRSVFADCDAGRNICDLHGFSRR